MRMLRIILFLLVLGIIALTGYAYFGDMTADPRTMRVPVELDLGAQPGPAAATPSPTAPAEAEADAAN